MRWRVGIDGMRWESVEVERIYKGGEQFNLYRSPLCNVYDPIGSNRIHGWDSQMNTDFLLDPIIDYLRSICESHLRKSVSSI